MHYRKICASVKCPTQANRKIRAIFWRICPWKVWKIAAIYFIDHCGATNYFEIITKMWSTQSKSPPTELVQPIPCLEISVWHSVLYSIAKGHRASVQILNNKVRTVWISDGHFSQLGTVWTTVFIMRFLQGPPFHPYVPWEFRLWVQWGILPWSCKIENAPQQSEACRSLFHKTFLASSISPRWEHW